MVIFASSFSEVLEGVCVCVLFIDGRTLVLQIRQCLGFVFL